MAAPSALTTRASAWGGHWLPPLSPIHQVPGLSTLLPFVTTSTKNWNTQIVGDWERRTPPSPIYNIHLLLISQALNKFASLDSSTSPTSISFATSQHDSTITAKPWTTLNWSPSCPSTWRSPLQFVTPRWCAPSPIFSPHLLPLMLRPCMYRIHHLWSILITRNRGLEDLSSVLFGISPINCHLSYQSRAPVLFPDPFWLHD